ncbi:tyrosine-type recombinase/integrase (plasmid) [Leptospira interrogans serovar Canicola]|uniref:Tyrosine-type recombinase/integrase n=1 Tax=Leptospira interrogans serovar Canicola TaxID=211880 RepID=A0AAP9WFG3_LEPIR|nr:tyrosine-type recombinase/integrase [Leptospira interrogans]QOI44985.1 tyrosine-type recombinase/integrase [Leptospira interrogans serovar Canicola]
MSAQTTKILKFEPRKNKLGKGSKNPPTDSTAFTKGLSKDTMQGLTKRFANPTTEEEYRNRALFFFMSTTGLRAKEIVSSKFSNLLEAPSGEILLRYIKKGGKLGYAVIHKDFLKIIREYHSKFQISSDYFFHTLTKRNQGTRSSLSKRGLQFIISGWNVKTCEGKNIHCHALRHTVGIRLLAEAGSIAVQKVLGHSSPTTSSKFYTAPYYDGSKYLLSWD